MRSFISIPLVALSLTIGLPAFAQDQGVATDTPITSLFERGGAVTPVGYEKFDIDAQLSAVLEQYCGTVVEGEDDDAEPVTLTIFNLPAGGCALPDAVRSSIDAAVAAQAAALIEAQTRIIVARAEAEAAQAETVAADAVALRNEAQLAAGLAVPVSEFDAIKAMVEAQDERFDEFETELTALLNLVNGDPAADGDAGLDGEVAQLGDRLLELETASIDSHNASVIAGQAIVNFCELNQDISWCTMLQSQFPQLFVETDGE